MYTYTHLLPTADQPERLVRRFVCRTLPNLFIVIPEGGIGNPDVENVTAQVRRITVFITPPVPLLSQEGGRFSAIFP